eukprot:CAMPEP_0194770294 /NCGR_PEP_ID=MMETSP0323_2-20130528/45826_1 /TAXON_ID=2866 ORGANISM="Crypthecodinium cohnii, Strain Seligo" /NCGR_SAMPLE_ID=MMETSP0323_2 /ASSEMBLY_ACC=CAM_ASM_000346 /LENGTH=37 /DNA_ID= /DNA_START= /DNA_END= /DNA_ORIENTATION=
MTWYVVRIHRNNCPKTVKVLGAGGLFTSWIDGDKREK